MPLTWDVTAVENYEEKYPAIMYKEPPTEIWNKDRTEIVETLEHDEREVWNPVTEVIVFACMIVGINAITEENVDEFYTRVLMNDRANGGGMLLDKGENRSLTYQEISDHIGMRTNASPLSKRKFNGKISRIAREEAHRTLMRTKTVAATP
jgi:hypothetical protein